jgi:hypothetical protein
VNALHLHLISDYGPHLVEEAKAETVHIEPLDADASVVFLGVDNGMVEVEPINQEYGSVHGTVKKRPQERTPGGTVAA